MKLICLIFAFIAYKFFCYADNIIEVRGHRGYRGILPENTLPSFAAAIEAGVDGIEMDLLVTKDNVVVIHHDFFLNANLCTYMDGSPVVGKILIRDLTLAEVKKVDCGRKTNFHFHCQKAVPCTQIPTLEEVITLVKNKDIRLILEVKRDEEHPEYTLPPELLAKTIVKTIKESGLDSRIYYSSFDPDVLMAIRRIDPSAKLEFIKMETLEGIMETSSSFNAEIISPEHSLIKTRKEIEVFQNAGFRVIPWTVNSPERWRELIEMGVDGIITDYPKELIAFLKSHCTLSQTARRLTQLRLDEKLQMKQDLN